MRISYSYHGKEKIEEFSQEKITIGRKKVGVAVDLDLSTDRTVSRPHASLWVDKEGKYWVKDLGSKHGTIVDGINIKHRGPVEIKPGTSMEMGNTVLKLVEKRAEPPPAPPTRQIHVQVKCLPTVNYSLIHAHVPFLSEVTVFNESAIPLSDVHLRLVLPHYAESDWIQVSLIPAKGSHTVNPLPHFSFDFHRLRDLPAQETVAVEIEMNGERLPVIPPVEVRVLSANAWHFAGHEIALAGFVIPNSDAINETVSKARSDLRRLLKEVKGFADAIESTDPKALEKILKAFYFFLLDHYEIAYEYERRLSYAPEWQAVRFHHEVLEELAGTCIDLALLFAACLESVHCDPLILVIKMDAHTQHAVVGCWRNCMPRQYDGTPQWGAVVEDEEKVRQWVMSGDIFVLDSIGFAKSQNFPEGMGFSQCRGKGIEYVQNYPLVYALDIVAAREAGIAPMPFGKGVQFDRSAWLALFEGHRAAERLHSPFVGARHLLLGLLSLEDGLMHHLLTRLGEGMADRIIQEIEKSLPRTAMSLRALRETRDWQIVKQHAEELAKAKIPSLVTEAVLGRALLETPTGVDKVLESLGLAKQRCIDVLLSLISEEDVTSVYGSSYGDGAEQDDHRGISHHV